MESQFKILIIDDDTTFLYLAKQTLELNGLVSIECETSTRIAGARGILESNGIDLILLDLKIPGESVGLEGLINLHREYPYLPIIIITGYADFKDALVAVEYGAQAIIPKLRFNNDNIEQVIVDICYAIGRYNIYTNRIKELNSRVDRRTKGIDKKSRLALITGLLGLIASLVKVVVDLIK